MKSRWQKKKQGDDHADDWLMTYADMITLLLCFFAVFLSVSMAKITAAARKDPVPQAAAAPVTPPAEKTLPVEKIMPPDVFADIHPTLLPGLARDAPPDADSADEAATAPAGPPAGQTLLPSLQPVEHPDAPVAHNDGPPPPVAALTEEKPSAAFQDIVDRLKSESAADIQQKGDRLTTLEMNSAAFFGSGSADLSEGGKAVLRAVAAYIKSDRFRDYRITVEGHTDDAPIRTAQFPSNWELSTARASAVVHFFLEQGVPAQRLRAAGYADTFPKAPNRDAAGNPIPANQAQNRRVVIKLEKVDRAG